MSFPSLCFSRFSRLSPRSLFFAEREGFVAPRELAGGVPVCEPTLDEPNDLRPADRFDFGGESSDAGGECAAEACGDNADCGDG